MAELPKLERIDRESYDGTKCFDILLNYNCSAKCLFCSQDFEWRKEPNDLPFEKAVEFMYMAYKNGYRRLGFTGGEPTIRPELPKLIALAKKSAMGTCVFRPTAYASPTTNTRRRCGTRG
ncbi:MAG: radical SAM protein [Elusimicrobiota bacterium]|nr:MAG: radical SAM protein [Elusimicrobiota bacterium]